jgi:thiamine monophosphate kinase
MALGGGEDYELLFTAGPEILAALAENARVKFTVIGEITADHPGTPIYLDTAGNEYQGFKGGWQHFSGR